MDMPENDPNVEPPKQHAETVNCGALDISSDWHMIPNSILNTSMGMHSSCPSTSLMNEQIRSFCDVNARNEASTSSPSRASANWMPNAALSPNVFMSTSPSMAPPHLLNRAVSCFDERHFSRMVNPFTDLGHTNANSRSEIMPRPNEALVCHGIEGIMHKNEARIEGFARPPNEVKNGVAPSGTRWREEAESSGCEARDEFWGKGSKKRKSPEPKLVITENNEAAQPHNQMTNNTNEKGDEKNPTLPRIPGDKGLDPLKEDYIHVRARRGQATNSHSLAERIRREKISERMKFLQDIVPGCSKVSGKAVMLDEIINYVQSLQRQVEFLSMKLAMVNLSLDFDMEGLLAKDILQTRAGLSSSLDFPPDMVTSFSPMQLPHTWLIHPTTLHRPINFQLNAVSGGFSEPTSQAPGLWEDDELHNVVHNGFNGSAPLSTLD